MYLFTLLPAILGLASASPANVETSQLDVVPEPYHWRVTHWQACCSNNACTYKCYVQAPANKDRAIPAFKAKCSARADGLFNTCDVLSSSESVVVQASLVPLKQPSGGPGIVSKKMGVSLSFVDGDG